MDSLEDIKATFFQECQELLADLEQGLLTLQAGSGDSEVVNAVFRAVHSIKGGAGAFGLDRLVAFSHVFETVLDEVRSERLPAGPELLAVMLRAADVLNDLVADAQGQGEADAARVALIQQELEALLGGAGEAGEPPSIGASGADDDMNMGFVPLTVNIGAPAPAAKAAGWSIAIHPLASMYAKANDITPLLRELERLGPCKVTLDASDLPPLDQLDPEAAYLRWAVELAVDCPRDAVAEVFDFVDGDCELSIESMAGEAMAAPGDEALPPLDIDAFVAGALASAAAPAEPPALDIDAFVANALAAAAAPAEPPAIEPMPTPALPALDPVKSEAPAAPSIPGALAAKSTTEAARETSVVQHTIRVDLERVDRLIDLVGELVINQAMLAQRVAESGFARSSTVAVGLDDLEQLTREIQDSVMAIRAQPVKSVFQRMPRLVREIAAATGKKVRLVTEGEGTEVDKTVIEQLTDPITHMIRNAVDHGLEAPEKRRDAGKPEEGTVRLAAYHRSGRIVIEVGDDGAGINRERVRQIAVDKGLVAAEAVLTEEETDNLLFLPGFSTASTISNISGRGVGMDVVKRSIQSLGGRISISSTPGKGSTFTMSLPLTLAVLDGMVVSVGAQTLVAPLTAIIETLKPKPNEVRQLGPTQRVLAVRGSYVPLIDIGRVLGWRDEEADPMQGVCLLVETTGGQAALLVDAIQGQRQVVIKSLEANYRQVPGIAAATILGDGRVALILDVDAAISLQTTSFSFALAS